MTTIIWKVLATYSTMTYNISHKSVKHKYLSVALIAYTVVVLAAFFFFRPLYSQKLWQGATLKEYVHEFSNIIPFYTVIEAIKANSHNLHFTLLAHLLAGIFPGYAVVLLCPTLLTNRRSMLRLNSIILCGLILFYWVRVLLKCGSFDIDDVLMDMVGLWGGIKVGLMHQSAKKRT